MLNLNGLVTKAGVPYSTLWSEDFTDDFFVKGLRQRIRERTVICDTSHVSDLVPESLPEEEPVLDRGLARQLRHQKAILGIFDEEGCMGMYNAILEDELINPAGIYKEHISQ